MVVLGHFGPQTSLLAYPAQQRKKKRESSLKKFCLKSPNNENHLLWLHGVSHDRVHNVKGLFSKYNFIFFSKKRDFFFFVSYILYKI